MKLFDIKVFTSNREYDVTLRNLTIIRASQIIHRIGVACTTLLRSIKRLLVPCKVAIKPLIKIRSIKSLRQKADVAVDASTLLRSRKRVTADNGVRIAAGSNISSVKKMKADSTWRIIAHILLGSKKPINGGDAILLDADMRIQKVRKRRLGEVSLVRPADMDPMILDELDYIVEE
jgi:hypothetical protein